MNPELARALVSNHIRDIRHEAALAAGPSRRSEGSMLSAGSGLSAGSRLSEVSGLAEVSRPTGTGTPQLRSRIGFALVEAGLRLLADRSVTVRPGLD